MLVVSRKLDEELHIGKDIVIKVVAIRRDRVFPVPVLPQMAI